jgi:hypothetical protein
MRASHVVKTEWACCHACVGLSSRVSAALAVTHAASSHRDSTAAALPCMRASHVVKTAWACCHTCVGLSSRVSAALAVTHAASSHRDSTAAALLCMCASHIVKTVWACCHACVGFSSRVSAALAVTHAAAGQYRLPVGVFMRALCPCCSDMNRLTLMTSELFALAAVVSFPCMHHTSTCRGAYMDHVPEA